MKSILPDRVIDVAGYNLRNKNNFRNPKYDKVTTRYCFVPKSVNEWNLLPDNVRDSSTYSQFQIHLKHLFLTKRNTLFTSCSGQNGINLTRMRMGLSVLNWHRFKYHFITDSKCGYCNARREDPAHFLFICPRFADPPLYALFQASTNNSLN
jgi:hypothetical protein